MSDQFSRLSIYSITKISLGYLPNFVGTRDQMEQIIQKARAINLQNNKFNGVYASASGFLHNGIFFYCGTISIRVSHDDGTTLVGTVIRTNNSQTAPRLGEVVRLLKSSSKIL